MDTNGKSIEDQLNESIKIKGPYDASINRAAITEDSIKEYLDDVREGTKEYYEKLGIEPIFHDYINKMKTGFFEDSRVKDIESTKEYNSYTKKVTNE